MKVSGSPFALLKEHRRAVDKQSLTDVHDVVASSLSSINVKNLPCYNLRTIEVRSLF